MQNCCTCIAILTESQLAFLMSIAPLYLVIDQGTSSTKSFLFDETGNIIHTEIIKHRLQYLVPFHVECDPKTILNACKKLIAESIIVAGRNSITKVGIAVQRSTFLFWEKNSAEPVTQALSWQDSRAQNIVNELSNHSDWIWEQTGAPLSPHFGGPKFLHMIRMNPDLRKKVSSAQILYGPLSAYLTHALTGTATVDESIAGRTLFFNIHSSTWSKKCLDLFQIPESGLPLLKPVLNNYGLICDTNLSLQCVIGDQQAALIGQAGLTRGCIATNFGTSASVLYNAGENPIVVDGLISSVLLSDGTQRKYLVEGTINACNSLFYHLEKELKLPHRFMKWHELCSNQSTNGIYVPGFAGLAAPYWKSGFNDIYRNLDHKNKNEIIRAGMESIGFLVKNILDQLQPIMDSNLKSLTAGGGGARPPLLQFIADLTGIPITNSAIKDCTAYGVFLLLRPKNGNDDYQINQIFSPRQNKAVMEKKLADWKEVLESIVQSVK